MKNAGEMFKQSENKYAKMNQDSSRNLIRSNQASSKGSFNPSDATTERPDNLAYMFVVPGRELSSTMAMMLESAESFGSLARGDADVNSIEGSKETLDKPGSR